MTTVPVSASEPQAPATPQQQTHATPPNPADKPSEQQK